MDSKKTIGIIVATLYLIGGGIIFIFQDPEPVPITIDGQEVVFQYTDENIGEDLIILTDQITYTGISRATVRFVVRNESGVDQSVDMGMFFDDPKRKAVEVKRLPLAQKQDPIYEEVCTAAGKAASSSPSCELVETGLGPVRYISTADQPPLPEVQLMGKVYEDKIDATGKVRKSVNNYVSEKKVQDVIKAGEFALYEAEINFAGALEGKFYIEAVGSQGGYGHLDPWYSNSWTYRKKITITGGTSSGTGYQVLLKVGMTSAASGEDFDVGGNSAAFPTSAITGNSGGDFRFTDDDGSTELDFWVQNVVGSGSTAVAHVWVQVNDDLGSNQDIYIYYGNGAASNASNCTNTFEFCDEFNDGTIDLTKWSTVCQTGCQHSGPSSSSMSESGGLLRQLDAAVANSQSAVNATTSTNTSGGFAFRARFNRADTGTFANNNVQFHDGWTSTTGGTTTPAVGNNNNQNQVYCNGTNFTQVQLQASDLVNGTYYMYEARRESTTEIECALYSTDNALLGTEANNVALSPSVTNTVWPGIRSADGFDQQTDWAIVRKFKETEPVFSSAAAQEVVAANNWNMIQIHYGEIEVNYGGVQIGR